MKHDIKVIFFDLGNTLIFDNPASWADVYLRAEQSLWSSLHKFGVNSSTHALFGEYNTLLDYYYNLRWGKLEEPGIGMVLKELLYKHKIHLSDENLNSALRSMYAVTQTNWYLEDDAIATLQALLESNYRLGIISNGSDDLNTYELLEKVNLRSYFEFILSSAAFGKRKPHPAIFRAGLDHFKIPPDQTVMVGDTYEADILGARQLGMNTIWITRRHHSSPADQLILGDEVASRLSEIPALLST
jgi:HAD superfamily hydrolase (TIGR01662 family)